MAQTIAVASTNPVKIEAARRGFGRMFPTQAYNVVGIDVGSGVSEQPTSREEAYQGALKRARGAARQSPEADFTVGIEGGIEEGIGGMRAFAWVVVLDDEGTIGRAMTGMFYLPEEVAKLIRGGKELGEADDIVFGRENSKQENGAIGLLTDNAIERADLYTHAVILALVPFKNPDLHWPESNG